jgi:hypothetical protein
VKYAVLALAVIACGKGDDRTAHNVAADPDPAVVADPRPADKPGSPKAWFADYRAAHDGATVDNAIDTGKKIWPMLASDAQAVLVEQSRTAIATLAVKTHIEAQDVAYKLLGETAATRAAMMHDAKLAGDDAQDSRTIDGHELVTRMLHVTSGATKLDLPIVAQGGGWKLAAGPHLVAGEDEVFHAPATGTDAPAGVASLDAVAAKWKQVIAIGNGWDAMNIMSPAMHAKLLQLVASMGGTGPADVARIFEKTLVDRRNRGITVESYAIDGRTDDHGTITMKYSNGAEEAFSGVRVNGVWWLEVTM